MTATEKPIDPDALAQWHTPDLFADRHHQARLQDAIALAREAEGGAHE